MDKRSSLLSITVTAVYEKFVNKCKCCKTFLYVADSVEK
jgi:hypothetical protein